jgi:hypothetical protein
VRKIAQTTVEKLREMDPSVADALDPVITTKNWETLFQTSITGDHGIPLNTRNREFNHRTPWLDLPRYPATFGN